MTETILCKVQVTSLFRDWWESDLKDIFANPEKVKIISAVVSDGGLYLIYTIEQQHEQRRNT